MFEVSRRVFINRFAAMEIDFLRHFDFPQSLIDSLRSHYGNDLLPLQEKVIREGRLFDRSNLLICSPTSSGKTFLAEILFLYYALKGKNTILLVPAKALASQRYQQLRDRYAPYGYDILLSTRDHPFHDRQILDGQFHLAVIIYEKMRSLLAQNSAFAASLGVCVVDEIHYLFDPNRGPDLEILLTRLREEKNLQILGISAIVSDPQIAEWLGSRLIIEKQRPVELRQGVLCQGKFTYREFNSGKKGIEKYYVSDIHDEGQAMLEAARYFAARGETTLLFWPRRDQCYTAARKLAEFYEVETRLKIPALSALEPTAMRDFLALLLPRRIAIHTSDLTSPERELVESMARAGEIALICATSTLAEGVNFPVINALTTRRMYASRMQDALHGRPPAALPLSLDRFRNMTGRAGRLGFSDYGRGIVLTTSPGDVEGLLSLYIHSEPSSPVSTLTQIPLSQIVLKTMGYCGSYTLQSCHKTLLETLSGTMGLFPDSLEEQIEKNCADLIRKGYITEEQGVYYPTPLGDLVMRNGLSELSAQQMELFVLTHFEEFFLVEVLTFVCLLREMEEIYLSVSRAEIQSHTWSRAIKQLADEGGTGKNSYLRNRLAEPAKLRPDHHEAFKKTLLLFEWINGCEISDLENRYGVYSGTIARLAEETSWLLGSLSDIAAAHALDSTWSDPLLELKERILYGLPQNGLSWSPFIRKRSISRTEVLRLLRSGFERPSAIKIEDRAILDTFLPRKIVEDLLLSSQNQTAADDKRASFILELDDGRPDRLIVNGIEVFLTPLQSRLVRVLSRQAGSCVEYEDIIKAMWPDSVGDKKKVLHKKNELLKKISRCANFSTDRLIDSVAGVGLVLNAQVRRLS